MSLLSLMNMGHVMWQDLTLFTATQNAAQLSVVTTPLPTGLEFSHILKFTGNASPGGVSTPNFGTANMVNHGGGTRALHNIYLRWSDITPATEYRFLALSSNDVFDNEAFYFVLETDGDIRVVDDNDSTIATITNPLTVDTWHRLEFTYRAHGANGSIRVLLDGSEILSNTIGLDTGSQSNIDFLHIEGPLASSGDMFYAGHMVHEIDTPATDVWPDDDFEIIGPYQVTDLASATPDTGPGDTAGDDLDIGNWNDAAETPVNETNTAEYRVASRGGGVYLDSGSRSGPSGDSRIDGDSNIKASQGVFWVLRENGALTVHTLVSGNKTDEYDAAETFATNALTSSYRVVFVVSEAATAVPTSTQFGLLGMEMDTGTEEMVLAEAAMFLLHVPSAGGTTTQKTIAVTRTRTAAVTNVYIQPLTVNTTRTRSVGLTKKTSTTLGVTRTRSAALIKATQKTFQTTRTRSIGLTAATIFVRNIAVTRTRSIAFSAGTVLLKAIGVTRTRSVASSQIPTFSAIIAVARTRTTSLTKKISKTFSVARTRSAALVKATKKTFNLTRTRTAVVGESILLPQSASVTRTRTVSVVGNFIAGVGGAILHFARRSRVWRRHN